MAVIKAVTFPTTNNVPITNAIVLITPTLFVAHKATLAAALNNFCAYSAAVSKLFES